MLFPEGKARGADYNFALMATLKSISAPCGAPTETREAHLCVSLPLRKRDKCDWAELVG